MSKYTYSIRELVQPIRGGFWGENVVAENGNARVVRNGDILENGLIKKSAPIRKMQDKEISKACLQVDDILLTTSGNVGKTSLVTFVCDEEGLPYIASNFVKILRVDNEIVMPRYLYYFLRSNYFINNLKKYTRGATMQNLSSAVFDQPIINLPSLTDQAMAVSIIGQIESLIEKRETAVSLLNEYTKSVFLKIVGNLSKNSKNWKFTDFGNYISTLTDYHSNGSYETLKKNVTLLDEPSYALMVRTTDLENSNFTKGVKYIDKHAYEFLEKSKVFGGEIIINKIGSAGKVYLMPNLNIPVSLGMNAFMIRLLDTANVNFIYTLLTSEYGEHIINRKVKGAVTKTIRKDAIRGLQIPIIPIELQANYSSIVDLTNNTKLLMSNQLSELNNHYQSVMQKVFRDIQ